MNIYRSYIIIFVLALLLILGCGGSKASRPQVRFQPDWYEKPAPEGWIYIYENSIKNKENPAKDDAEARAKSRIATLFSNRIQTFTESMTQELGLDDTATNREAISTLIQSGAKTIISGGQIVKSVPYDLPNGQVQVFMCYGLDKEFAAKQLAEEMRKAAEKDTKEELKQLSEKSADFFRNW